MSQFKKQVPKILININNEIEALIDNVGLISNSMIAKQINAFKTSLECEGSAIKRFQVSDQTHIGANDISPEIYRNFQKIGLSIDRFIQAIGSRRDQQAITHVVNDLAIPMARVLGKIVSREHNASYTTMQYIVRRLDTFGVEETRSQGVSEKLINGSTGKFYRTDSEMRQKNRRSRQAADEATRLADLEEENERRQKEDKLKRIVEDLIADALKIVGASTDGVDNWFDENEAREILFKGIATSDLSDQGLFGGLFDKNIEILKSRVKARSGAWSAWKNSSQVNAMIDDLTRGLRGGISIRQNLVAADLINSLQKALARPEYFIEDDVIRSEVVEEYKAAQVAFFDTSEMVKNINQSLSSYGIAIGEKRTSCYRELVGDLERLGAFIARIEGTDASNDVAVQMCTELVVVHAKQFSEAISSALVGDIDKLLNDKKGAEKLSNTINSVLSAMKGKTTKLFSVAAPKVLAWLFDGLEDIDKIKWKELSKIESAQRVIHTFRTAMNKAELVSAYWVTLATKKDGYCNDVFIDATKNLDISNIVGLAKFCLMNKLSNSEIAKKSFATSVFNVGYQYNPLSPIIKDKFDEQSFDLTKLVEISSFMMAVNNGNPVTNKVSSKEDDFISVINGAQGGIGKIFNMADGYNANYYSSNSKEKDFADFAAKESNINPIVLHYFLDKVFNDKKTNIAVAPYNRGNPLGIIFNKLPTWLQIKLKEQHSADGRIRFQAIVINNIRLSEKLFYHDREGMNTYYQDIEKILTAMKLQGVGDCTDELAVIFAARNAQKDQSDAIIELNKVLSKAAKKMEVVLMLTTATIDGLEKKVKGFIEAGIPASVILSIVQPGASSKQSMFYEKLIDVLDKVTEKIPGWFSSSEKKKYEKEVKIARARIEADIKKWKDERTKKEKETIDIISSDEKEHDQEPTLVDHGQEVLDALLAGEVNN